MSSNSTLVKIKDAPLIVVPSPEAPTVAPTAPGVGTTPGLGASGIVTSVKNFYGLNVSSSSDDVGVPFNSFAGDVDIQLNLSQSNEWQATQSAVFLDMTVYVDGQGLWYTLASNNWYKLLSNDYTPVDPSFMIDGMVMNIIFDGRITPSNVFLSDVLFTFPKVSYDAGLTIAASPFVQIPPSTGSYGAILITGVFNATIGTFFCAAPVEY